jgi:predicted site-specific integrase-resolvase
MLGKKEAADYLGMSTRTLERYVNDGRLSVRYEESTNGQIALFDPQELDQLKEQKQIPRIKPAAILNG